ncbi:MULTISPECIES: DUF461 domain-containing protein [unclassified Streptomyces]|uniref:DUF461 domain-containing protein n=1 Tax=unclassified Streptomyces TaxID=2593676 RepID=UPI001F04B562|nr:MULTISPECIES: DUF461 domain-containing protein [unclassified Streptomyces]MCH0561955.1 DUF461 domain-containing protein [Streptomyces sp. MUM 2J]MCH0567960.1 DUF461 domain-containing protein [Streptomyces sp. MUM 136J]
MSSSLRRGALAASVIAVSIASLAACGAGNDAQTLQVKPDNAATSVGAVKIQNALVITQPERDASGPAVVSATVFNTGTAPQTLDAVKVNGVDRTAELKPAEGSGKLSIPAGGSLVIGGKGNAAASLPDSNEALQDGNVEKVTFTFSETGDVSLNAFVVPATSYFSAWGPSDVPSATTAAPSGTPSEGVSASPSESASGSPAGEGSSPSASASE